MFDRNRVIARSHTRNVVPVGAVAMSDGAGDLPGVAHSVVVHRENVKWKMVLPDQTEDEAPEVADEAHLSQRVRNFTTRVVNVSIDFCRVELA